MKYYRVKPQYDNKPRYKYKRADLIPRKPAGILFSGQLFTVKEFEKLANDPSQFDVVEINKNKTHKILGARFEA